MALLLCKSQWWAEKLGRAKVAVFFLMVLLMPSQACLSCCKLFWCVFLFFLQSGKDQVLSILLDTICPLLEIIYQWTMQNQGDCFVTTNFPSPAPPAALIAISVNYLKFLVLHTESNDQCAMSGVWLCTPWLQYFTPHLSKCLFPLAQPLDFIQQGLSSAI